MKKTLLTTTFLIAGAFSLLAQGLVSFYNDPYSWNDSIENGGTVNYLILTAWPGNSVSPDTRVFVSDAAWSVQLYENGTARGGRVPFYGTDWPGVWNAFADPDGTQGIRTLGVAGGTATQLQLGIFNATGAEVLRTAAFGYTPPTSATPPPDALLMSGLASLGPNGLVVPEPSTIALGVLGLGALLLFRHRK